MSYRLLGTKRWSKQNFFRLTGSKSQTNGVFSELGVTGHGDHSAFGRRYYALFCVNSLTNSAEKLVAGKCRVGTGDCNTTSLICYSVNLILSTGFSSTIFSTNRPQSTIQASVKTAPSVSISKKKNEYKVKFAELIQSKFFLNLIHFVFD